MHEDCRWQHGHEKELTLYPAIPQVPADRRKEHLCHIIAFSSGQQMVRSVMNRDPGQSAQHKIEAQECCEAQHDDSPEGYTAGGVDFYDHGSDLSLIWRQDARGVRHKLSSCEFVPDAEFALRGCFCCDF